MRRCEKDIIESGNSKAQRWFNLIKSQTSNLEGEELLRFILDGKTGEEVSANAETMNYSPTRFGNSEFSCTLVAVLRTNFLVCFH